MTRMRSITDSCSSRPAHGVALGLLVLALWTLPAASRSQEPAPVSVPAVPVDAKLQLIGSLASSHVYTTFGYIGVVWDNSQKGLYTPESIDQLMREVTVFSDSLTVQLVALQKTDLTPDDAKAVQEIIEIYALLKQESNALRTYAKDKTETNGKEFQRLRAETWTRVAKLLEIPAVKAVAP